MWLTWSLSWPKRQHLTAITELCFVISLYSVMCWNEWITHQFCISCLLTVRLQCSLPPAKCHVSTLKSYLHYSTHTYSFSADGDGNHPSHLKEGYMKCPLSFYTCSRYAAHLYSLWSRDQREKSVWLTKERLIISEYNILVKGKNTYNPGNAKLSVHLYTLKHVGCKHCYKSAKFHLIDYMTHQCLKL